MSSRFIHIANSRNCGFFFNDWKLFYHVCVTIVLIFSSTEGHLSWLQILALVNGTAVNTEFRCLFLEFNSISFRYMSNSGIFAQYSAFTFYFLRSVHTIFHNGCSGQWILTFMNVTIWRRGGNISWSDVALTGCKGTGNGALCSLIIPPAGTQLFWEDMEDNWFTFYGPPLLPSKAASHAAINPVRMFTRSCGELPVPTSL